MRGLLLGLVAASGFGTSNDADWPPSKYRGVGTTTVMFVRTQAEIDRLCGKAPKHFYTEACATDSGLEVLPDPCGYQGEYARIGCHENAHRFGGWSWKHPR